MRHLLVTCILADLCVMATVWPDILKAVLDIYERKLARVISAKEVAAEVAKA